MNNNVDLSIFSFFSSLSKERLAEIESFSILQHYKKGDIVFDCNEPARNLYGIVSGEVDLSILFKEKIITKNIKYEEYISTHIENLEKPITIETVQKGDMFGWSALVEPEKMTATARCNKDCDIVLIPAVDLKELFARDPELGYHLSSQINSLIAQRLNNRTENLVEAWCTLFETEHIGQA